MIFSSLEQEDRFNARLARLANMSKEDKHRKTMEFCRKHRKPQPMPTIDIGGHHGQEYRARRYTEVVEERTGNNY